MVKLKKTKPQKYEVKLRVEKNNDWKQKRTLKLKSFLDEFIDNLFKCIKQSKELDEQEKRKVRKYTVLGVDKTGVHFRMAITDKSRFEEDVKKAVSETSGDDREYNIVFEEVLNK